jgi:protein-S-isoprenylcysteine O-methyltransferase Ste14
MALVLKNLLFTFFVPGTVAIYMPLYLTRGAVAGSGPWQLAAALLFGLGGSIYTWCIWDFASFGRGTPAPIDAPKQLVVRGLYRYSRNPMYVGVLSTILGWVVLYRAAHLLLYGLSVATAFQCFVVFYEEPHLRHLFGTSYEEYQKRVGRWLPRL